MSLWLRRRDLRTLLYIAIIIKFLATFEYIFIIFPLILLLDFIVVTINLIQLLTAILITINYLSIYHTHKKRKNDIQVIDFDPRPKEFRRATSKNINKFVVNLQALSCLNVGNTVAYYL